MLKLCCAALACAVLSGAAASAEAGGIQPLACSQGDEIRTIDYYMDVNMERMQEIQSAEMESETRQQALEANTQEFIDLQQRREILTQECAQQIKIRNDYYQQ
ncbi:MAG: hypothetical protein WDZ84_10430 [Rhodovibrionaceae bacterium]